jgi:hypothetical protein
VNLELIYLGPLNGRMLSGDGCGIVVEVYVPLDRQLSGLFVDGAEIASLFCGRRSKRGALTDQGLMAMANINGPGRIPIGPLCGRLLNQIDVLALRILPCAEKKHPERSSRGAELRSKERSGCSSSYMLASIPLTGTA